MQDWAGRSEGDVFTLWRSGYGTVAPHTCCGLSAVSPCPRGAAARPAAPPATLGLLWLLQILGDACDGCLPITHIIKAAGGNRFHSVLTGSCSSLHSPTSCIFFLLNCWHQAQHQNSEKPPPYILTTGPLMTCSRRCAGSNLYTKFLSPFRPSWFCFSDQTLTESCLCSSGSLGSRHWYGLRSAVGSNTWEDKTMKKQDWPERASDCSADLARVQPSQQGALEQSFRLEESRGWANLARLLHLLSPQPGLSQKSVASAWEYSGSWTGQRWNLPAPALLAVKDRFILEGTPQRLPRPQSHS